MTAHLHARLNHWQDVQWILALPCNFRVGRKWRVHNPEISHTESKMARQNSFVYLYLASRTSPALCWNSANAAGLWDASHLFHTGQSTFWFTSLVNAACASNERAKWHQCGGHHLSLGSDGSGHGLLLLLRYCWQRLWVANIAPDPVTLYTFIVFMEGWHAAGKVFSNERSGTQAHHKWQNVTVFSVHCWRLCSWLLRCLSVIPTTARDMWGLCEAHGSVTSRNCKLVLTCSI